MNPNLRHLLPGLRTGVTTEGLQPDIAPQDQRPCSIAPLQLGWKNQTGAVLSSRRRSRRADINKWFARTFPPELRETIAQALAEAWMT